MNYKKLGNTDLNVSTICLGTMTWGEQNSEREGFEQMDFALSQGVNFWDTAEIYSIPMREETYGETEKIIGNWFQKTKKRNDILFRVLISVNDIVPIIRKIIPITNNPTTRANVLNIIIASSDGLLPNASLTSVNLNSGDIIERKRGNP